MNTIPVEFFDRADLYRMIAWAIGPTILAMIVLAVFRFRRWRMARVLPTDNVEKSMSAKIAGGLPAEVQLIAGLGTQASPHDTLGEMFLRPTWGLRLVTVGLLALLVYFVYGMQAAHGMQIGGTDRWSFIIMGAVMLYVLLYLNIYELRYDRDRFAHRNWFFQFREYPWKKLLSVRDDGAYYFIVHTTEGKKTYIPKHLIGIEDFMFRAQSHIATNDRY